MLDIYEWASAQWKDVRAFLGTWGGKLAAIAAPLVATLSDQAATAIGFAWFVPEGWPRTLLLIAVAAVALVVPMKAQKADIQAVKAEVASD